MTTILTLKPGTTPKGAPSSAALETARLFVKAISNLETDKQLLVSDKSLALGGLLVGLAIAEQLDEIVSALGHLVEAAESEDLQAIWRGAGPSEQ